MFAFLLILWACMIIGWAAILYGCVALFVGVLLGRYPLSQRDLSVLAGVIVCVVVVLHSLVNWGRL